MVKYGKRGNTMKQEEILNQRSMMVYKANDIVQKSKYDLSLQGQKLVLYIISMIKPDDPETKRYTIPIKDFCQIMDLKECGVNYKRIRETITAIENNRIWVFFDNQNRWKELSWLAFPDLDITDMYVEYSIDPRMRPFLFGIKEKFTMFELNDILKMRSKYSIRIYELLKSYRNVGLVRFSVQELKEKLMIEKYDDYGNFRDKVLNVAVQEISMLTDMDVTYKPERTGRRITHIVFCMESRQAREIAEMERRGDFL